jgi:hypothetical protein
MVKALNKSNWPKPNKSIEAALGRFIIAWNVLEQQVDFAIHEMTGLDHDLATCVTANLGTKAKLDMCQALAHCMGSVIGSSLLSEIDKLAGETANASGQLRNFIFHGQPFQFIAEQGSKDIWIKLSARKGGVRGPMVRLSSKYANDCVATTKDLVKRWEAVREKVLKELSIYDCTFETAPTASAAVPHS